jgi:hypothetical protein
MCNLYDNQFHIMKGQHSMELPQQKLIIWHTACEICGFTAVTIKLWGGGYDAMQTGRLLLAVEKYIASIFRVKEAKGGSIFLQNNSKHLQHYTVSYSRRH